MCDCTIVRAYISAAGSKREGILISTWDESGIVFIVYAVMLIETTRFTPDSLIAVTG
tara:strand:- start:169 stop:339 length:171 start_codon:yes stop_codon:yes gene_type:complete